MTDKKISVLLVDDSAVIRGLIARILAVDPEIEVVGSRSNGEVAIAATQTYKPDIVILDIEMPVMDGITALPKILEAHPQTKVLICSTLSDKNADISLKALSLGAAECILKPSTSRDISEQTSFRHNLVNLVRTLSARAPLNFDDSPSADAAKAGAKASATSPSSEPSNAALKVPVITDGNVVLRKLKMARVNGYEALAIGSSTGGPQALFTVLKKCKHLDVPIFITQHMPPTFTRILAQHIEQNTGLKSHEAQDGLVVEKNNVYVAAGGYHMVVRKEDKGPVIYLDEGAPENYCKPSVEPMMRSLIDIYGNKLLTVILTGMGHDGLASCSKLVDLDVPLIAQDKKTSVVWGMPGAVASAQICTDVLPLDQIGDKIASYMKVKVSA